MKRLGAILISFLVAVALVGCGGSSHQSAKACWTKETRSELTQLAGADQVSKTERSIVVTSVNAQAAGVALPAWLPGDIKTWLHATQEKCGSLKS